MKTVLIVLVVVGWVCSLVVHLAAVAGIDVATHIPAVHWLPFGAMVGFLAGPFIIARYLGQTSQRDGYGPRSFFRSFLVGTPWWLWVFAGVMMLYPIVNIFLTLATHPVGESGIVNGQYVQLAHGRVVRTLSAAEYTQMQAAELRFVSGHWVGIYGLVVAMLYRGTGKRRVDAEMA